MYSPALTTKCNEAMKKWKELMEEDILAYVKHPAVLMVKRPGEGAYTQYAEY